MRILFVDHYGAVVGGAQTYERAIMPALQARGHELALLHQCRIGEGEPIDAGCGSVPRWCVEETGVARAVGDALAWGPDVVYVHGLQPDLEAAIAGVRPSVLYAHNYYGTCATGRKFTSRPSPRACERTLGPSCLAINYVLGCGLPGPRSLLRTYRAQSSRLGHLPRYGAVLVASRWMEAEYQRHGVPAARLHRVPHFPATVTAGPEPPPERTANGQVLLAGRLMPNKGGTLLVDALAIAGRALGRPLTLLVAGEGAERSRIEERAREQGVAAKFFGWLDPAGVAARMREVDLLALPSVWPEPFGLVGIEAGTVGVPAVGFATGGITDWLRAGESGELADAHPPTAEGFAEALVRALRDPAHLAKLRVGAWRVASEHSIGTHLDLLEPILRSVALRPLT